MTRREQALQLVSDARDAAQQAKADGELHWTSSDPGCPPFMWLAALMEELGEVGRAVHDHENHDRLITELAQLAGVAVGRIEALLP